MKSTLPRFCIQYIYLYMHTIYIIYIYTVPHKKTHQKTSQKIFYKTKPKCNKSLYVVSQIILPRNHVIIYFNLSSQRIHDNTEAQRSRQSPTAEPPDFQPLTDGLRRRLEARVHGIVLRGTWDEGQRRILQECSVDGEDVASDVGDVKRLLHLPAGPRPTAYRAKDTFALLRRETPSFSGQQTHQTSVQLSLGSNAGTRLPDSNTEHRRVEGVPFRCVDRVEAEYH